MKKKLAQSHGFHSSNFSREFIVQTDVSLVRASVILALKIFNNEEHSIVYLSTKFSRKERNYNTIERRLEAIIFRVRNLNHYLDAKMEHTNWRFEVWMKNHFVK